MPLLKHQLILHPDIVGQFALDKPVTPYERQVGFSWYLCPVSVANKQEWMLVNIEFGYCDLVESGNAADIEQAVLDSIEHHLPDDREEDNVSVILIQTTSAGTPPTRCPSTLACAISKH
jgi:hypothetical protein